MKRSKGHSQTFGDAALSAGVEGVARKQGDELRLTLEFLIILVEVDEVLKTRNATDWLGG